VRDATGELIYQAKPQLTPALSPPAALDATSVLQRSGGTRCFTGATAIAREPRLKSLLDEFVKRLGNQ
jgi:hypothetical protein